MQRWKSILMGGLLGVSLTLTSLPAQAGTYSPWVDWREHRQQERIYHGVRTGRLTPGEARLLEREQARIHRAEARMWSDGVLTRQERARLHQMENHASRHIYRGKHNGRRVCR